MKSPESKGLRKEASEKESSALLLNAQANRENAEANREMSRALGGMLQSFQESQRDMANAQREMATMNLAVINALGVLGENFKSPTEAIKKQ